MSQRPSTLSVNTSSSHLANGHAHNTMPTSPQQFAGNPRLASSTNPKLPNDSTILDPDELFTKHTVSEVKFIQQRLRTDADAKQEELRLMVGERYRDLLQASTSIISIARSSNRVIQALEETKDAILAQEEPPLPRRMSVLGGDDTHLHTLQLLSAHMKLLLDAPEHLWRLIERKKYFSAAWLFLLARVVHRALVRDDEQDEVTWSKQGVDVLEQFPLVQRQWEAVAQFRPQIIHKATLSLREYTTSHEDSCATLLTLHLLDSRPLLETLSVFLGQRSRSLQTMLSWKYEMTFIISPVSPSQALQGNGHVLTKAGHPTSGFRRTAVREVREATQVALNAIAQTVKTTRSVFQENDTQPSLIRRVLEHIQSDSPDVSNSPQSLPSELYLTTQNLLMTLPSSTHFLLLPANLRSYKPYVDLNSSSVLVPQLQFTQKVDEWFRQSANLLKTAMGKWLSELQNVKEVWSIRLSIRKWICASGPGEKENFHLLRLFDDVFRKRVSDIWISTLREAEKAFQNQLQSSMQKGSDRRTDASLTEFLFQPPPLPVISQGGLAPVDSSFRRYKAALQRQLVGRTSLLEDILNTLENCARTIRQDLNHITMDNNDETRQLVGQLTEAYQPEAEALCNGVVHTLESVADIEVDDSQDSAMDSLIFLGRVTNELASASSFISDIHCEASTAADFKKNVKGLHGKILIRWQKHTVTQLAQNHHSLFQILRDSFAITSISPSGPSSVLIQSLFSLSCSIRQFGTPHDIADQKRLCQTTLRLFITALVEGEWGSTDLQAVYDLAFLGKIASLYGSEWADVSRLLNSKIKQNDQDDAELQRRASEFLSGTQTLFASLLPGTHPIEPAGQTDKFAPLLPYGLPVLDSSYHSAIDLAKPTSRFALLLVGGAAGRS